MERKNTILGVLFLAAAFALMVWSIMHPPPPAPDTATATGNLTVGMTGTVGAGGNATMPVTGNGMAAAPTAGLFAPAQAVAGNATTYTLDNDDILVTFTENGGAIESVALKKFPAHLHAKEPVVFNQDANVAALALEAPTSEASDLPPQPLNARFSLVAASKTTTGLSFDFRSADGLEITRNYSIQPAGATGGGDPYLIEHETTLVNRGTEPVHVPHLYLNVGTIPPTPEMGTYGSYYLDFGYYDGTKAHFVSASQFVDKAPMLGLVGGHAKIPFMPQTPAGDSGNLEWVSVKNEFFAAVLSLDAKLPLRGSGFYAYGPTLEVDGAPQTGVSGGMRLNFGTLAPGQARSVQASYFVGPKEYVRLDQLGQRQDLVMEFGWTGALAKMLLVILIAMHKAFVYLSPEWAWGWSIILFTVIIKLLTWPLTATQVANARKMGEIQKPMAALKEKYKDKPEKLQQETMELWKKHKINPAAGCLPILIQIPIFFAFNSMLRTASELRFASFLWIQNLAAPDTVATIGGFHINILPILYTTATYLQMRMVPTPTTDDTQRKVMQFMPLMMFFMFYSMPSGMVLYFTCQNLLTVVQQMVLRRKKDAPPTPDAGAPQPAVKR